MSRFGSAVVLGDLDDFLAPTQACVNPLFVEGQQSASVASDDATPDVAQVTLHSGIFSGIGNESVAPAPKKPDLIKGGEGDVARVSLTDCLACSGCVTSAETVLITEQSVERLVAVLQAQRAARVAAAAAAADAEELQRAARRAIVVSVSPQAQAAFATHLGVSAAVALRKLVSYFKTLGAARVYDTSECVELSVVEACVEFAQRFTRRRARRWAPPSRSSSSSNGVSEGGSAPSDGAETAAPKRARAEDDDALWHSTLPMLSSSCPGWVCFAEKRHPEILPYVATTKSAQAIAGSLVKKIAARELGLAPGEIFHVTLMPCFDKKLEASRGDFTTERAARSGVREVDLVVTPIELLEAWQAGTVARIGSGSGGGAAEGEGEGEGEGGSGAARPDALRLVHSSEGGDGGGGGEASALLVASRDRRSALVAAAARIACRPSDAAQRKEGSGGYLERIFRFACEHFFGVAMRDGATGAPLPLAYAVGRSADWQTVELRMTRAALEALRARRPGESGAHLDRFLAPSGASGGASGGAAESADPIVVMRFALAYGFGNVQKAVRHIRQGAEAADKQKGGRGAVGAKPRRRRRVAAPSYDFIEMMACPGGCLNGGGQLPPSPPAAGPAAAAASVASVGVDGGGAGAGAGAGAESGFVESRTTKEVRAAHLDAVAARFHAERSERREERGRFVRDVYAWLDAHPAAWRASGGATLPSSALEGAPPPALALSDSARFLLHTRYHTVAAMQNPLTIKW